MLKWVFMTPGLRSIWSSSLFTLSYRQIHGWYNWAHLHWWQGSCFHFYQSAGCTAHLGKTWRPVRNDRNTGKTHNHKIFLTNFLLTEEETFLEFPRSAEKMHNMDVLTCVCRSLLFWTGSVPPVAYHLLPAISSVKDSLCPQTCLGCQNYLHLMDSKKRKQ